MHRISILLAAGALVATPAVGAWTAYASNGSDDPTGHVRTHHRGTEARHGVDDGAGHRRHAGEVEPGDDRGGHGRHHHHHGGDD
jgi:hypothetical protein